MNAQNEEKVNCSDVQTGVFTKQSDDNIPFSSKIVRTENFQREYIGNGSERSSRLKWLNNCSYLMLPYPKKEGEDPNEEILRKYEGIEVTYTARKGDTIYFTAKLHKMENSGKDL